MKVGALIELAAQHRPTAEWWGGFKGPGYRANLTGLVTEKPPPSRSTLDMQAKVRKAVNALAHRIADAMPVMAVWSVDRRWKEDGPRGRHFSAPKVGNATLPAEVAARVVIPGQVTTEDVANLAAVHADVKRWQIGGASFCPGDIVGTNAALWAEGPEAFYGQCTRELRDFTTVIREAIPAATIISPAVTPGGVEANADARAPARNFASLLAETCEQYSYQCGAVCDTLLGEPLSMARNKVRFLNVPWAPQNNKPKIVGLSLPLGNGETITEPSGHSVYLPTEIETLEVLAQLLADLAAWGADEVWLRYWYAPWMRLGSIPNRLPAWADQTGWLDSETGAVFEEFVAGAESLAKQYNA